MSASAVETLDKLRGLASLYDQGYRSETVDLVIDKLLTAEVDRARSELRDLESRMAAYESLHAMPSDTFYRRFCAGELGDDIDFVEWSVYYEMRRTLLERLRVLEGPNP